MSAKKADEPVKKGKGYKDAQWEAEVRKSLANKKASATSALSKQDQALVDAQLEKERDIRSRVNSVKARLERGLNLIHSLSAAGVSEMSLYLSSIAGALLKGFTTTAVKLVGYALFERYLVCPLLPSSNTCQPRTRNWHNRAQSGSRLTVAKLASQRYAA